MSLIQTISTKFCFIYTETILRYTRFKRYQINKKATRGILKKHPWIFSGNLSSAATSFKDGEYLKEFRSEFSS